MPSTSQKPVEIRALELEDLAAVYALGEKVFTADRWPTLYRTWDEYEPVNMFSNDGEFCFVAEQDARIVGFALGSLIEKRRSAWTYGYLTWLAIDPKNKRAGIATRLIDELTEAFIRAGASMMLVDTDAENEDAIGFFENHGFGQAAPHVYLSKNLTNHPDYRKLRHEKD